MKNEHPWYFVALFDALGFEAKFAQLGLSAMADLYEVLIGTINSRNAHNVDLREALSIDDEAVWTAEGDAFVFNRVDGAYASDSIVLWAHAHFPAGRELSPEARDSRAADLAEGWKFMTIPCDRFLDACNEVICRSLEIGLPLRGSLALGEAIIDERRRVFLGRPIIDAARGERAQRIIGASPTPGFMRQTIPNRFLISTDKHVKQGMESAISPFALDWPRHWRRTREGDARLVVSLLNTEPVASIYYENALNLIDLSEQKLSGPEDMSQWSIRANYSQFSSAELRLGVRAVRHNRAT